MAITITEALAEIKTIDARVTKKSEFIRQNLCRQDVMRDPLAKDGGAEKVIAQERQSITDLGERRLALRRAIQKANESSSVTVNGSTRTVADWLVWRREVAPIQKQILAQFSAQVQSARADASRKGVAVVTTQDLAQRPTDLIININEKELAEQIEATETILGTLDGKLSLHNATAIITL